MSREKITNMDVAERLFILVEQKADGNVALFSRKAAIPPQTMHYYIKDGRLPHADHLIRICGAYNVNLNWLLAGKGEPYIESAREKLPEVTIADLPELVEKAIKVLTSDNRMAVDALARNIVYFAHAIDTEQRMAHAEQRLVEMESRMTALESQLKYRPNPEGEPNNPADLDEYVTKGAM
jgi:hypothetical protein